MNLPRTDRAPFHVKQPTTEPPRSLVLFDGVCNLCNATVLFIIDHDPREQFRFAPLQSTAGVRVLEQYPALASRDSIVLLDSRGVWAESDAAIRIARRLGWPWRAAGVLRIVPGPIRDALYRWIARNRYRWFGLQDRCRLPTPALAHRFLDDPAGRAPG
jgi:predicted DCC family thiol-disulfide oxidoreductase YuxK